MAPLQFPRFPQVAKILNMPKRPKLLSELVKSRANRVSGMGLNGLAASSIGFAMLGCIAVGYFGGAWLDRKLGTSWAMPAGTFLGMIAGFVEMFRTLRQVTRSTKWPGGRQGSPKEDVVAGPQAAPQRQTLDEMTAEAEPGRQRLFNVPPPPLPEYGTKQHIDAPSAQEVKARLRENQSETAANDGRNDNE